MNKKSLEIRSFKYRDAPFHVYYSPDLAIRTHDHGYILRLISDWLANYSPDIFQLLPQFRTAAH
jgi:hypothetical protein